jgi:hypothetical protein
LISAGETGSRPFISATRFMAATLPWELAENADLGMAPALQASPITWMPGTRCDSKLTWFTGHHFRSSPTSPAWWAIAPAFWGGIRFTTSPFTVSTPVSTVRVPVLILATLLPGR